MHPPGKKPSRRDSAELALAELCDGFLTPEDWAAGFEPVEPDSMPDPFCNLLVHHEHMTTRLAEHYGRPVELRVLRRQQQNNEYSRLIALNLQGSDQIVEVGIVRLNLGFVSQDVRKEILSANEPLGQILINHDVLRRIEPRWYYRFAPQSPIARHFGSLNAPVYGRWGVIYCDEKPAIRLLEIVRG
jgi:chorismate-pyruvate lyase